MATITGLTAERMQEIIDAAIVDANIVSNHLILEKQDGSTIDAGSVIATAAPVVDTSAELAALELGDAIEAYFDCGNNIYWHLRYNLALDRWHVVGGPPLAYRTNVDYGTPSGSGVGVDDFNITVPLAGKYRVQTGGLARVTNSSGIPMNTYLGYKVGATAMDDNDTAQAYVAVVNQNYPGVSPEAEWTVAANTAFTQVGRDGNATFGSLWSRRWMRITPIYVTT